MEVCFGCHPMRKAQLQRSSHMPLREGEMTCANCHNPHGGPNPKMLVAATVNETCYKCHPERRGPPAVAEAQPTAALPGVSRVHRTSVRASTGDFALRVQPGMHQLSFPDSWLEPSGGEQVPALEED